MFQFSVQRRLARGSSWAPAYAKRRIAKRGQKGNDVASPKGGCVSQQEGKTMTNSPILLVEDNEDDIELTLRALKKHRIMNEVVVARDGVEALDYLLGTGAHEGRDLSVMPQVVLLDLNLPRIGGIEVLRRLRTEPRTKLLAVVVLTSSKEEEDIVRSYALGANSYVRKPVDFSEFSDAVKTLGLFWLLLHQAPPTPRMSQ